MKRAIVFCLFLSYVSIGYLNAAQAAPQKKYEKFPDVIQLVDSEDQKSLFGRDFIGSDTVDIASHETFKKIAQEHVERGNPFIIARSVGLNQDTEQIHYRYYPIFSAHDFIFGTAQGKHFGLNGTRDAGIRFSRYKKPAPASKLFGPERFKDDIRGYMIPPLRYYASLDGKRFVYLGSEEDISEASASNAQEMTKSDRLTTIFSIYHRMEDLFAQDKVPSGTGDIIFYTNLGAWYEDNAQLEEAVRYYTKVEEMDLTGSDENLKMINRNFGSYDNLGKRIKELKENIDKQKGQKKEAEKKS